MLDIAVVSINKNKYSETFIHNQVELLPAKVHLLYGGYLPIFDGKDNSLSDFSFLSRIFKSRNTEDKQQLIKGVEKYLVKHNIKAVLAQYGPSGVEMMDICSKLNIPLIVHFHGYDAYRNDIMNSYGGS